MSSKNTKVLAIFLAAALAGAANSAAAQDPYGRPYDDRYDPRPPSGPPYGDERPYDDGAYDYAQVVDVQPLTRQVRVSTPQRECWDETRYEPPPPSYGMSDSRVAGGTLLGAVIGGVIGHAVGHNHHGGRHEQAATAGGAVIGAAIGNQQAKRRSGYAPPPPREYTVQRCETRYRDEYHERIDGYRVTYLYNGRRQVTQLPYNPGERIRVRVDVTPAEQ
jgi:uncharacterized protein YcfJ